MKNVHSTPGGGGGGESIIGVSVCAVCVCLCALRATNEDQRTQLFITLVRCSRLRLCAGCQGVSLRAFFGRRKLLIT